MSDYGALVVTASAFIVLSLLMWVAIFNWFRKLIDRITTQNAAMMKEAAKKIDNIENLLMDIGDALRPAQLMQIKTVTNAFFDLSVEQVCRIVQKVKTENHIADRVATKAKIVNLIANLHDDRNSRLDNLRYGGKPLSRYTCQEWVQQVADVVEREVYAETENANRTYTNVETIYDRIRLDMYHRITGTL